MDIPKNKGLNLTANCQEKYMEKYFHKLSLPLKFLAIILLIACTTVFAQTRQELVHQMAHSVMPFDLQHEAERFQHGDYSDPAMLHGADMPSLEDLEKGASRIKVSYAALPSGAEIMFETTDLHLLTAVHRWFGA